MKHFMIHHRYRSIVQTVAISVTVAGLLAGCHSGKGEEGKAAPAPEAPATRAFTAQKGKLSASLGMPGELIAYQQVDLYAKVNSFVKKLYADVGSEVKEGQVLATLEAPEIGSQLSAARSRVQSLEAVYMASKANYDRLYETSKTPGTISPNDLDLALARQKSDHAQWQAARSAYQEVVNNQNYLTVKAPFSGIITARNVSAGAYVGPSGKGSELPIFTLQEQHRLRLAVAVPEAFSPFLQQQNAVEFTVKSLPGKVFKAQMNRLAGALDNRLRSQRVEMDVYTKDRELLPGMVAEVTIPMPARDSAFVVPSTAVVASAEGIYVLRSRGGRAEKVPVQKGREAEGKTEVYGGLVPGDTLLTNGTEELRTGEAVGKLVVER
jgi:membrane fusion protein (multidrug efflux system)